MRLGVSFESFKIGIEIFKVAAGILEKVLLQIMKNASQCIFLLSLMKCLYFRLECDLS